MPVVTHLLVTTGDPAPSRMPCAGLARIGATSVVFQPTEDEPDLEGFVEFVGRDVRVGARFAEPPPRRDGSAAAT